MIKAFFVVAALLDDGEIQIAVGQIYRRPDTIDHFHAERRRVELDQSLPIVRYDRQMTNSCHSAKPPSRVILTLFIQPIDESFRSEPLHGSKIGRFAVSATPARACSPDGAPALR